MNLYIRLRSVKGILFILSIALTLPIHAQGVGERGTARHAMVATEHALASEIGERILREGGNAVDAAVAVGFVLSVVYPEAGNIGGGGFMVIRFPDGSATSIDYRETAPAAAHEDAYIDEEGILRTDWSLIGARAAGVPGSVAGLLKAWEQYGSMPLAALIEPGIALAREGFILRTNDVRAINGARGSLSRFPETEAIFFPEGRAYRAGDCFRQEDLARTLERIRDAGHDGFYSGETADYIVRTMEKHGGWITHLDLAEYRAVEREPVRAVYRGHEIITMGPPSSGGIALIQMLLMLQNAPVGELGRNSVESIHLFSEVMKRAFAHRYAYVGDPDFVTIPLDRLLSAEYCRILYESISPRATYPIVSGETTLSAYTESTETTHYSVVDESGLAVAVTTTINSLFGSKLIVEGAGFLLNNEMNDFSLQPGTRDQFGLVASNPNKIEPGKRMVSSMTPTIVVHREEPVLIFGARGGPRIISAVFHVIPNFIDFEMHITDAISGPVFHHQWQPDRLEFVHRTFPFVQRRRLREMGNTLVYRRVFGRVVAIAKHNDVWYGATNLYSGGGIRGY
jgi:gamma-glutamyltranspeptidase / glutathione hydrolase